MYGIEGANALKANCAMLVVYTTNDKHFAEELSITAGNYEFTEQKTAYITEKNKQLETKKKKVISMQKIMNIPFKTALIFYQGYLNKPIEIEKVLSFTDPQKTILQKQIDKEKLTKINRNKKETYDLEINNEFTGKNTNQKKLFKLIADKKRKDKEEADKDKEEADKDKEEADKDKEEAKKITKNKIEKKPKKIKKLNIKKSEKINLISEEITEKNTEKLEKYFNESSTIDQKIIEELFEINKEIKDLMNECN